MCTGFLVSVRQGELGTQDIRVVAEGLLPVSEIAFVQRHSQVGSVVSPVDLSEVLPLFERVWVGDAESFSVSATLCSSSSVARGRPPDPPRARASMAIQLSVCEWTRPRSASKRS